jgi:hypothetical protein
MVVNLGKHDGTSRVAGDLKTRLEHGHVGPASQSSVLIGQLTHITIFHFAAFYLDQLRCDDEITPILRSHQTSTADKTR